MITEILATGDEIRTGVIIDSNSAHIAEVLEDSGLKVVRHSCVGDDMGELVDILKEISGRADVAVVTGGLGPTTDDLTAAAAASAADVPLALNEAAMRSMEAFFEKRKLLMSISNRKQAMLPRGAECLENPIGTAPGFSLQIVECLFFFLPGVPAEMRRMLKEEVLPRIREFGGPGRIFNRSRTLSTFGLTESATGERLSGLERNFPEIKVGMRIEFPVIHVKLYARGEDDNALLRRLNGAVDWASVKLGRKLFSIDGSSMEAVVGRLLLEKGKTVAVAESCTGGLIAHRLTNVPGSSSYFLFSGVTYSNEAKIRILGVSQETLAGHGAVHEQTAMEMAEGARQAAGADYGLSTTGIAGPEGGSAEKPVGTVCIGLTTPEGASGLRFHYRFEDRLLHKKIFATKALDLLRRELLNLGHAQE
jgi:nicotinamide-nucleotide amidase